MRDAKRRKGLVRGVLAMLLTAAMTGGIGYAVASTASADGTAGDLEVKPSISKSVTKIAGGDGDQYELHLTASGDNASSQTTTATPADIVIVADKSASMREDNRDTNSRRAVQELAQKLLTPVNAQLPDSQKIRMAVVTFSTQSTLRQGFTDQVGGITSAMAQTPDGGTNWEAALAQANRLTGRQGVNKYIIFLSDGNPTFRTTSRSACYYGRQYQPAYDSEASCLAQNTPGRQQYRWIADADDTTHGVHGHGNSDAYGFNYDAALAVANQRGNAALYVVKTSADANRMSDLAAQAGAVTGREYDGTNAENLADAFDAIYTSIISTATIKVFSISDTLSEWVDPVDFAGQPDGSDITPYVTARNGDTALTGYKAVYNVDSHGSRTVTVTFSGNDGMAAGKSDTIDISFRIKPSDAAYADYAAKGAYPSAGDDGTGAASAGKQGYLANGDAQMRYCALLNVNGTTTCEPQTIEYRHPVVQVRLGSIDITKQWSDGADKHTQDSVTVQLQRAAAGEPAQNIGGPIELNAANHWAAQVDGLLPGYTYTVVETSGDDRYAVTYQYGGDSSANGAELTKRMVWDTASPNAGTLHAVITNTLETTVLSNAVTVRKQLDGRAWTGSDAFTFTLAAEDPDSPMPAGCTGKEPCAVTVDSDSPDHTAAFGDIVYEAGARTYRYSVTEQSGSAPAMHYSQARYQIDVTVAKSQDGTWQARVACKQTRDDNGATISQTQDGTSMPITFTNRYTAVSALPLTGGATARNWLLAAVCTGALALLLLAYCGTRSSMMRLI